MELKGIKESIRPVSDFRKALPQFLKRLKEDRHPLILTQRGRSVAVLIDVDTYEQLEYQSQLRASHARGLQDIERGKVTSHDKVFKAVRSILQK